MAGASVEPYHSTAITPMRASLRAGRKIDTTPEIHRANDNITRQIKALPIRLAAPSGTLLREAGQPLRERAAREKRRMKHRRHIAYRIDFCTIYAFCYIVNTIGSNT